MTVELVTGHSGSAHISGEDVGNLLAGTAGPDCYVLGDQPVPQMRTANLLSIPACDLLIQGRHVRLTGSNTVGIDSGTQTGKRADLVYLEYSMDESTGVEKVSDLMVAKGAAGTSASDPSLPHTGSILDAGNPVDVAVARVTLDGLTPKAEWLLPVLPSIASLGDSVSQSVKSAKIPARTFFTSASHAVTMAVSWPVDVSRIVAVVPTYTCNEYSDRVVLSNWDESGVTLRAGADQEIWISLFVLYV